MLASWKKSYDQHRQHVKKQRYYFANKGLLVKAMVFPVVRYGCESWTKGKLSTEELMPLKCCVGEDSWESLGLQGDPSVHPKGNQSWIFIGRTDAKAETPMLWPPDAKNWFIWKDPDAGKDWRIGRWLDLEKIGERVGGGWGGWMASLTQLTWVWVNSGVGVGLGGLVCCCPGACRVGHYWVNYLPN